MNAWLSSNNFDFKWVNEDGESFKPFDFVVRTDEKNWYLEVKATEGSMPEASAAEEIFISPQEIHFAMTNPVALARIYQTRSESPRVLVLKTFSRLVRANKIECRARISAKTIKKQVAEEEAGEGLDQLSR